MIKFLFRLFRSQVYFKADAGKGSWATYFRSLTGKVWAAYASATLIVILAVTFIYYSRKSVNVEKSDDTFGLLGLLMEYGFMVFTIICLQGTSQSLTHLYKHSEKSEISSLRVNHLMFYLSGVSNEPKQNSTRIAFFVVIILAMILYNSYAAFLTSFLAVRETQLPFKSLSEMHRTTNFKVGPKTSEQFYGRHLCFVPKAAFN